MAGHQTQNLEKFLMCYTGADEKFSNYIVSMCFGNGKRVISNVDDAESILTYLLALKFPAEERGRMWKDHLLPRVAICKNIEELLSTDLACRDALTKNIMRVKETLWPIDQAIYSSERCTNCKQKTIYYVSPQVRSSDEEQAFFAVCTRCGNS
jgi:DNA-directed RNA polymerase subunit M/transcription elongation factor TFIIS